MCHLYVMIAGQADRRAADRHTCMSSAGRPTCRQASYMGAEKQAIMHASRQTGICCMHDCACMSRTEWQLAYMQAERQACMHGHGWENKCNINVPKQKEVQKRSAVKKFRKKEVQKFIITCDYK